VVIKVFHQGEHDDDGARDRFLQSPSPRVQQRVPPPGGVTTGTGG
jgi:hypothetical protein